MSNKVINHSENETKPKVANFCLKTNILKKGFPTGLAYIFNNNFDGDKSRKGSDKDVKALQDALPKLGFHTFSRNDIVSIECLQKLEDIATNEAKNYSSLLVVFLSHGTGDSVTMNDGKHLSMKMITQYFQSKDEKENKYLQRMPKVFMIQACRGSSENKIHSKSSSEKSMSDSEEDNMSVVLPTNSNILVCYSSSPSYKSYRNVYNGSRFIQTFTTIINDWVMSGKETDTIDFVSLMTTVAAEVAEMDDENWFNYLKKKSGCDFPTDPSTKNEKISQQMPWFSSTLMYKLEFKKFRDKNAKTNERETQPKTSVPADDDDKDLSDDNDSSKKSQTAENKK